MVLGDAFLKLETIVWILNRISRSITWSLYTLKASYLVKWPISAWFFMWGCQFIDSLKFETRPSSLLNFGMANVDRLSNHPPALLKNIPQNINKRLIGISSTEQVLNEAIGLNQQALEESGFDYKFKFDLQARQKTRKSKNPGKERPHGTTLHKTAMSSPTRVRNFCSW